ncbi:hypothetical protein [Qipengyuania marisflavi]|uniref:Serine kinase n=1 Tax=Qipengyuania marisflavi TaxID=2486356 RepID=A0A5S3P6Y7_9SPHN|nr:hypothetical protein [Qipengyuania marisflavi]TMM48907.1 hypothetical protein FEV51_05870 [Qipengyuania marisflavi]
MQASDQDRAAEYRYRHSGLIVASALPLPEWEAFAAQDTGAADVTIALGEGPMACNLAYDGLTFDDGVMRFQIDDIGGWEIAEGNRITLFLDPAADMRELRLFTLGSAWGALGYQRGHAMWHGSAVAREGHAVLLCGDAGEGKSTMAGALLSRGGTLVADDLSRIAPGKGAAVIHPSSARLKLWREAIDRLGWQDRVIERDYYREDKFHCSVAAHAAGDPPMPLAAVVVLTTGEAVSLERLQGGAAVQAALRGTMYRPEMLEALGEWAQQGALAARIAVNCPVWRLTRPRDFAALDEACAALAPLWPGQEP